MYYTSKTPEEQAAAAAAYEARYVQEQAELASQIKSTTALIVRIGELLGMFPKEHEGNEYGNNLVTLESDTFGLHFYKEWNHKDKLKISGTSWPTYTERSGEKATLYPHNNGLGSCSIMLTEARGADAIAKEIKRRLLPNLTAEWDKCKKIADETTAANDAMYQNALAVAAALGTTASRRDAYNGEIRVHADDATVSFQGKYITFSMTAADAAHAVILARHILAARAEYVAQETAQEAQPHD